MANAADNELIIACGADDGYAMQVVITLSSLARSQPETTHTTCFLLDGGIGTANIAKMKDRLALLPNLSVHWLRVDSSRFGGLLSNPLIAHLSQATLLRLTLPEILPPEVERILYIDCDVLVTGDLLPLYHTAFGGNAVVAVQDFLTPVVSEMFQDDEKYKAMPGYDLYVSLMEDAYQGVSKSLPFFNAGVLLLDIAHLREAKLFDAVLDHAKKHSRVCDQDSLNVVLNGAWTPAPYYWNLQSNWRGANDMVDCYVKDQLLADGDGTLERARIIHFTGKDKPWSSGLKHPFAKAYQEAMQASQWFTPLEFNLWKLRWFLQATGKSLEARLSPPPPRRLA